jgi:hypothetical protein
MTAFLCGAKSSVILLIIILPQQGVESLSLFGRLANLVRPSSTQHLADLLEMYDKVQSPEFLKTSTEWKSTFRNIMESVEVTTEGVVEGRGLIATRDFAAGEVVALYPYVYRCLALPWRVCFSQ